MSKLSDLRAQIDEIDRKIVELYEQRMLLSDEISREKIETGSRMFDKDRENRKIAELASLVKTDFLRHTVEELYEHILSIGRRSEYHLLKKAGASGRLPFFEVERLASPDEIRVVYQGVEGAYSQAAMFKYFGENVSSFHVRRWRDAMEAIADGAADFAVLPIENSTAGIVAENFDLLVDFENYIVAEQVIRCEHVLMGLPGTKLSDIERVYSHQQALAQCEQYLDSHPDWQRIPFDNTALAAQKVAQDQLKCQAAIGSAFAAKRFGLEILAEHVYHNQANSTRFIIVTNQRVFLKGADKISICFEGRHSSGSLYHILSHIIYNNLNMQMIESRPIPGRNWEYRFFVDLEGNLNDSSVRTALRGIRMEAINLKILGNYIECTE